MKLTKKAKFLATIIAAAMLTATIAACESAEDEVVVPNDPDTVTDENTETPETPDETTETPAETPETADDEELGEYVVEVYGVKFDLEKATMLAAYVDDELVDITAEEAFEKEQANERYQAEWEGMALARLSNGISYNSVDDPDAFDAETFEVFVEIDAEPNDIIKVYDGDVIGGLTIKNAKYAYAFQGGEHELKLNSFEIMEDITLTGYIMAAAEEEMYVPQGTIFFAPDNAADLVFTGSFRNGSPSFVFAGGGDMVFYTDGVILRAGEIYGEDLNFDISLIPTDGTSNHVTVTFTDITLATSDLGASFNTARIVDINQA